MKQDWIKKVMALTITLSFVGIVWAILFYKDLPDNDLVIHLAGLIEGTFLTVLAYYFKPKE